MRRAGQRLRHVAAFDLGRRQVEALLGDRLAIPRAGRQRLRTRPALRAPRPVRASHPRPPPRPPPGRSSSPIGRDQRLVVQDRCRCCCRRECPPRSAPRARRASPARATHRCRGCAHAHAAPAPDAAAAGPAADAQLVGVDRAAGDMADGAFVGHGVLAATAIRRQVEAGRGKGGRGMGLSSCPHAPRHERQRPQVPSPQPLGAFDSLPAPHGTPSTNFANSGAHSRAGSGAGAVVVERGELARAGSRRSARRCRHRGCGRAALRRCGRAAGWRRRHRRPVARGSRGARHRVPSHTPPRRC
jgi:hypothetical protein